MKNIILTSLLLLSYVTIAQTVKGVITQTFVRTKTITKTLDDVSQTTKENKKEPLYYSYTYSNGSSLLELASTDGTKIDTTLITDDSIKNEKFKTTHIDIKPHEAYYYKNFSDNIFRMEISQRDENNINTHTSIRDTIPRYLWSLQNENQTIAGYDCKKATTIKKVGHRSLNITAWYCENIPINDGPMDYSGLPGLILQIEVNKNTIIKFEKLKFFKNEKIEVLAPKNKTKMLTISEYINQNMYSD